MPFLGALLRHAVAVGAVTVDAVAVGAVAGDIVAAEADAVALGAVAESVTLLFISLALSGVEEIEVSAAKC